MNAVSRSASYGDTIHCGRVDVTHTADGYSKILKRGVGLPYERVDLHLPALQLNTMGETKGRGFNREGFAALYGKIILMK